MPLDSSDNRTRLETSCGNTRIHGVSIQLHGFRFHSISNICFANTDFNGYEMVNCWMLRLVFPRRYENSHPSQVKYLCLLKHPSTLHYKPRLETDQAAQFTLNLLFPTLRVFHRICSNKMLIFLSSLSICQLTFYYTET